MAGLAVAIAAIVLVAIRPRRVPVWCWTAGGAVLLLVARIETPETALLALAQQWNVLLFIAGLMGISAAAEESGLFAWIADVLLARAGGSRRRLFVWLYVVGAALTILLSNDATAIVFTPVVYRAVAKRGIDALPYLYACTFVADTASIAMPFSNPANVLVLEQPHLAGFVSHLGPPALVAIGLNLAVFAMWFRKRLRGTYAVTTAAPIEPRQRRVLVVLAALVPAYLAALAAEWPLGPVAAAGAVAVALAARATPRAIAARIGWSTLLLLAGLFVLLAAVEQAGSLRWAQDGLQDAARSGPLGAICAATFGAALAANLLNNLPVAAISGTLVHGGNGALAYGLLAGVDLGPNLTTTGSLATILWLAILRERGLSPSPLEYLRLGLAVVPAMLLVTALWLWLVH